MKSKTTYTYIKISNVLMTYKIRKPGTTGKAKITFANITLSNQSKAKKRDRSRRFNPKLIELFKSIAGFYNIKPQQFYEAAITGEALVRIDTSTVKNDEAYRAIADRLKANFTQAKALVLWAKKTQDDFKEFRTVFKLKSGPVASILACEDILLSLEPLVYKVASVRLRYVAEDNEAILKAFEQIATIDPKPNKSRSKKGSNPEYRARISLTDADYDRWTKKSIFMHKHKLYYNTKVNTFKNHNMCAALINMIMDAPLKVGGFGVRSATIVKLKDVADDFNLSVANANKCKKEAIYFNITDFYKSLLSLRNVLSQIIDDKEI